MNSDLIRRLSRRRSPTACSDSSCYQEAFEFNPVARSVDVQPCLVTLREDLKRGKERGITKAAFAILLIHRLQRVPHEAAISVKSKLPRLVRRFVAVAPVVRMLHLYLQYVRNLAVDEVVFASSSRSVESEITKNQINQYGNCSNYILG